MKRDDSSVSRIWCWVSVAIFAIGLIFLAERLKEIQVDDAADYNYANSKQSIRRMQTAGIRGRILDRNGTVLADSRWAVSIVCNPTCFQRRTWRGTVEEIEKAIGRVSSIIGKPSPLSTRTIKRHVNQSLAMPLIVWRDIDEKMLAVFSEHECDLPGFEVIETEERIYPHHTLAAHVIGYVGRDRGDACAGDERISFFMPELRGRSGLEMYYNGFLRGVPGERKLLVDARGFAISDWVVVEAQRGPDLKLSLDVKIQREAERQLRGERGACVVLDAITGEVLAMASAPDFDINSFVPVLSHDLYNRYAKDPQKPLLNRASGGAYAPGSTFKPIVALAGLQIGYPEDVFYTCSGVFSLGDLHLHCARRWGHGEVDLRHALMESCNPFFCNLAMEVGTNSLITAARAFGLGMKTGIDLGVDMAGVIPDADWKMRTYHERWFPGDLAQMGIGQGMLLVSPLQMARIAAAIGTGRLVVPHLKAGSASESAEVPFSEKNLAVVRDGMRMVVAGDGVSIGGGWRGGDGVAVSVSGKTGTAEIGEGNNRRKNTWFVAFAPTEKPKVAIAMIVENGQSGGATAAPKVAEVLKVIFGAKADRSNDGGEPAT